MVTDTIRELEKIFMTYDSALNKLKLLELKTKTGKEITYIDLQRAVQFMIKKHPTCRWKQNKLIDRKNYILAEGVYWLTDVYFQKEKSIIDADIDFFTMRIKQYEDLLKVIPKNFWNNDMFVYELPNYFNRVPGTIKNNIIKMNKATNSSYKYYENGKAKISKEGIEWICKNCFKQKYLELLEEYKMELTEKYIKAGYPYDVFLTKYESKLLGIDKYLWKYIR